MNENIVDKVKSAASNVKNVLKKVVKIGQFIATPIGQVIGILILVLFLIVVVYVIAETIGHAFAMWTDDDYAGIATTGDYETIIGGISYAGYDSFISEEKAQEYMAFEYAVLMDVAEHIYEYQDYVTIKTEEGIEYETSAVIPEGIVKTQYDADAVSKGWWQNIIVDAQDGYDQHIPNQIEKRIPGGNQEVVKPRLIYETANHEYEENAISLMPYLVIVREDLKLNYFLQGLSDSTWKSYSHLEEINSGHLVSDGNTQIEPVRFSAELNRYNNNMPNSAYKKDLEEDQKIKNKEEGKNVEDTDVIAVEDNAGFIKADRDDVGYGDDIYYTEEETDIVYKIPLKLLVNRYLPKSTLLTTWYMLKKDSNDFRIDELMQTIKEIYTEACYRNGMDGIEAVNATLYSESGGSDDIATLRTGEETIVKETIENAVKYDEYGAVERDENGNAILVSKDIEYATTNKRTFIYFEQFGLETSRYELYKAYRGAAGDEAMPNAESPAATYLTRERVNFIQTLNLRLPGEIIFINNMGLEVHLPFLDVRLKPTYSFIDEEQLTDIDLEESLKSLYLFNGETGASVSQEKPYNFMKEVVRLAEEKILKEVNQRYGSQRIVKYSGDPEDGETIYDHYFINQFYMRAEDGNEGKAGAPNVNTNPEAVRYRLPEDFRYYNQDDQMPHWYDLKEMNLQVELEKAYLEAFREVYASGKYDQEIRQMLAKELGLNSPSQIIYYEKSVVEYTYKGSYAPLYVADRSKHVVDMNETLTGSYQVNYYWDAIYNIEVKTLQMRQTIYHRRMPVVLVKYCDFWAKSVEYTNTVIQNPLNYRNYKYLIPNSVTSLGFERMDIDEKATYRTKTFMDHFNAASDAGKEGIKEGDVLDMLIQWEDYANKGGDESAYAFMRELYKLAVYIRDFEDTMLKSAYSYLYIPSTISNYTDETIQKIFWLERLGVTQGDDELTPEEQSKMRTKAIDTKWQNIEYDEYYECIYDVGAGEEANVYALFPFGASYIRSYYMLKDWDDVVSQKYKPGDHEAVDICSRDYAKAILAEKNNYNNSSNKEARHIYFYELNRLTLSYMQNGNRKEDAFLLAEKTLNSMLEEYALNSPVVAIAPGYVTNVDYDSRSGFYVVISHGSGDKSENQIVSFYAHLKRWPLVEVGEVVGAGTILGYEGTTGRSTGNHLHFSLTVGGRVVDPKDYLLPVFSPFYYDVKAKAVLDEDTENALGSEYYTLERTILPENALFSANNVINGMTLENGTVVNYNVTNRTIPYEAGEEYNSDDNTYIKSSYDVVWGNNVPTEELATSLDKIIDLNLLNQNIGFKSGEGDRGEDGHEIIINEETYLPDVTANPLYFDSNQNFFNNRLKWPKWFAVEMAEYKSELVVPYYNGPRSQTSEISSKEALNDLKAMQDSLRKAGYYAKANVKFDEAGYGTYSDLFVKVVQTMQNDLITKGYDVYGITPSGNLDTITVSAYNTMVQYTIEENQFAMAEKTAYNAAVDLSIEPGLEWAILCVEAGIEDKYLALKESNNTTDSVSLEYNDYTKIFNRDQGLMQIGPTLATNKYREDGVEQKDAVLYIRQPMRNTKIGMELIKENMIYFSETYAKEIDAAKNKPSGYWYTDVYLPGLSYEKRWCDPENLDRLMIYALALEAYDKGIEVKLYSKDEIKAFINVEDILSNGPAENGYAYKVLEKFRSYVIDAKK